jgi:hypothetical protein
MNIHVQFGFDRSCGLGGRASWTLSHCLGCRPEEKQRNTFNKYLSQHIIILLIQCCAIFGVIDEGKHSFSMH